MNTEIIVALIAAGGGTPRIPRRRDSIVEAYHISDSAV